MKVKYDRIVTCNKFIEHGYVVKDNELYSPFGRKMGKVSRIKVNDELFTISSLVLKNYILTGTYIRSSGRTKGSKDSYKREIINKRPKKEKPIRPEKPVKPEKELKVKVRPKPNVVIRPKPKTIKTIDNVELTYEIIISKGKGYLTSNAERMLIHISNSLINKFNYTDPNDKYDCKLSGFLSMLENWKNFDENKYSNAFPYFTEICKRGIASGLNTIKERKLHSDRPKISLNKFH